MENVFSTERIGSRERFDYWHEVVYRAYAPCIGIPNRPETFRARTVVADFGAAQVSTVASSPIRYERRPQDLRAGPRDDVFISLMLDGQGFLHQNGKELSYGAGDILVYDTARPYCHRYDADYRALMLRIPRPLVQVRNIEVDVLGGIVLPGGSMCGSLVASLMRESNRIAADGADADISAFSGPTLDMIAAALRRATGGEDLTTAPAHRALLERVKLYMKQHLANDMLTLDRIAKDQNVSVRTLSRMFAEAGTTPMGWLQGQRLAGAYAILAERRARSVTEAAFACGFNDLSHFSRSFKKVYGRTPNSLLTQG